MPLTGLPTTLEVIISSLLQDSKLSSYKIASNNQRSTLVIRFDTLSDQTASANIESTPASFRRNAPSQNNQHKQQRTQQQKSLQSMDKKVPASSREESRTHQENSIGAIYDSMTSKAKNSPDLSSSSSVLDKSIYNNNGVASRVTTHKTDNRMDSADFSPERVKNVNLSKSNHRRGNIDYQHNFLDIDRLNQRLVNEITTETKPYLLHSGRNNDFIKLLLDQHCSPPVILAETDDLIIEYDIKDKKIFNFIVKDSRHESQRDKMRMRHVQTWKDQTQYLRDECYDECENVKTALPQLKFWIESLTT